jgi:hypothetical protein
VSFEITNTPSAGAPKNLEDGLVPAKFLGITKVNHEDWAGPGKFGYDNGDRYHWRFALMEDDYSTELYEEGDPVEIEGVNGTNFNTKSDKSKNAAWLKAISLEAFAKVDAGLPVDPATFEGAPCLLLIEIKENGWPKIVNVLPAPKRRAKKAPVATTDDDEE